MSYQLQKEVKRMNEVIIEEGFKKEIMECRQCGWEAEFITSKNAAILKNERRIAVEKVTYRCRILSCSAKSEYYFNRS
ncbi:hypothetical protein P4313_19060 [Bacillus tropicus]|uniref:hypothetical protein n=1 Tax=Bacillus tropicus TaxID=2026188 RepID=UPI0011228324|nr:hypothetical protein [Bacillus tropicus]MED3037113.1 hypothetical protein [Bacillus tropicus]